ncbi:MAG: hypothetical protein EA427_06565 [Spirochaetaceae bacterium]|nr:MAG: hypothetical protein EA427_06565 [Spirochaetaceae bacterium]
MKARFIGFGRVEIEGETYSEDVMIVKGRVQPRAKSASRELKGEYGHTPLSEREPIPWDCAKLIVGTGAHGMLPLTEGVRAAARKQEVELVTVKTAEACRMLATADLADTNAILHLTC